MREGNDLTLVAFSKMVGYALKVATLELFLSFVFLGAVVFCARVFCISLSELFV